MLQTWHMYSISRFLGRSIGPYCRFVPWSSSVSVLAPCNWLLLLPGCSQHCTTGVTGCTGRIWRLHHDRAPCEQVTLPQCNFEELHHGHCGVLVPSAIPGAHDSNKNGFLFCTCHLWGSSYSSLGDCNNSRVGPVCSEHRSESCTHNLTHMSRYAVNTQRRRNEVLQKALIALVQHLKDLERERNGLRGHRVAAQQTNRRLQVHFQTIEKNLPVRLQRMQVRECAICSSTSQPVPAFLKVI